MRSPTDRLPRGWRSKIYWIVGNVYAPGLVIPVGVVVAWALFVRRYRRTASDQSSTTAADQGYPFYPNRHLAAPREWTELSIRRERRGACSRLLVIGIPLTGFPLNTLQEAAPADFFSRRRGLSMVLFAAACDFAALSGSGEAMSDQNKALTRDLYENIISKGQMDRLQEIVADDCFGHGAEAMGWKNGFLDHVPWFRGFYPDAVVQVDDMVAEGDRVVAYWGFTATHQTEVFGVPPTGKKIRGRAISQLRWRDGQLVEYQALADLALFHQQLGLIPASRASKAGSSEYRDKIEHFYQDAIVKGDMTAVES